MLAWCSISVTRISSPGWRLRAQEAAGHQIDALGGVADEDDLARVRGPDEALDLAAGRVVAGGGALAQVVDAAVDVGVVALVDGGQRVDDLARLLRAGGAVEIDQRAAMRLGPQDRELWRIMLTSKAGAGLRTAAVAMSEALQRLAAGQPIEYRLAGAVRTASSAKRSMTSPAQP